MASLPDASTRRIEQRSLRFGVGANVVMNLGGFSAKCCQAPMLYSWMGSI